MVGVDLPGWGKSEKPDLPYSVDWYVDWLGRLADRLGLAEAVVVGSSMGGLLGIRLAERRPGLVRALALVGSAGGPRRRLRSWAMRLLLSERRLLGLTEASFRRQLRSFFHREVPEAAEIARLGAALAAGPEWPPYVRAFVRGARTVIGHSAIEALERLPIPVLVLWGRQDRVLPVADAVAMHRALERGRSPSARLEIVEECGHYPPLERPDVVRAVLDDWLRSLV